MLFAVLVFSRLTILGDTDRYLSGPTFGELSFLYNSTSMMDFFAFSLGKISSQFGAHFFFLTLAFLGVYIPLKKLSLSKKRLIVVLFFLSFPSFGIWTSVVSKEAVTVFFMGIILAAFIDVYERRKIEGKFLLFIAIYLGLLFKPQYLIGIISLAVYFLIVRGLNLKAYGKLFVLFLFFLCSALLLYLLRDYIDFLATMMPKHFDPDGGSTRENTFWVKQYDVFYNAPYGMLVSFLGPTFQEAVTKPQLLMAFLESFTILVSFIYVSIKAILFAVRRKAFNIHLFSIFFIVTIWILFVHYPFGVLNPGSAIRYREGFYAFLVCLFYYTNMKLFSSPRAHSHS